MTFLEAKRALALGAAGPRVGIFVGLSGALDPLVLFMRASAALRGYDAAIASPPFGTLSQALLSDPSAGMTEVFLLCPWDLIPEADWRTGVSPGRFDIDAALEASRTRLQRLMERSAGRVLYVDAPLPPLGPNDAHARICTALLGLVASAGADILEREYFSLGDYLTHGCPFGGQALGAVAARVIDRVLGSVRTPAKVLVTDFDNTLWSGVLAEDGRSGIYFGAQGKGFRHFIYQSYLKRLLQDGVVLAGVTRNAPDIVEPLLESGDMVLSADDFVSVIASYQAKSAQIRILAESLNLGTDSIVFVDDNEVEIEEVSRALPGVTALRFATKDEELPTLLDRLVQLFGRENITQEDGQRTRLYRQRLESMLPSDEGGADITDFLRSLEMSLKITDRSSGERSRAVQLINKTNQFNLNGRRWTDEEIGTELERGGRLLCASLSDRTGNHGEVVACLIGASGSVESWVMSCRVFQRRVEHAFLLSLCEAGFSPSLFRFQQTARNEPLRAFLEHTAFRRETDGSVRLDFERFREDHAQDLDLFTVAL